MNAPGHHHSSPIPNRMKTTKTPTKNNPNIPKTISTTNILIPPRKDRNCNTDVTDKATKGNNNRNRAYNIRQYFQHFFISSFLLSWERVKPSPQTIPTFFCFRLCTSL